MTHHPLFPLRGRGLLAALLALALSIPAAAILLRALAVMLGGLDS